MTGATVAAPPSLAEPDRTLDRRRFMRAATAGSAVSLLVYMWMLLGPHLSLVRGRGVLGSFLDAQARSLLHGHLSVPPAQASIEGFLIHGHTYLYFGIVPSLLRIPVLLITHSLDGRLTPSSMLLAFLVLMAGTCTLHWQVRELVRPDSDIGRDDLWAAFIMQVAVGAGSVVLFLAAWPVVYDELETWGAAFAIAGVSAVVAVFFQPAGRRIAWAGLLSILAMNSRPSVGLAPALALVALAIGILARMSARRLGLRTRLAAIAGAIAGFGPPVADRSGRTVACLFGAALIALASAALIEYARFGTFGLPVTDQVGVKLDPVALAALRANHGSLFGLQFLPSQLLAAARPDAVGSVRAFPFIGLPHGLPTNVGNVRFESVEQSLSTTTSMSLLCLLTVAALPALVRRSALRQLTGILIACAIAFVPVLVNADIATRYLSDALPLLVLGSLIGLQTILARNRGRDNRARRFGLVAGASILTAWGIAMNGGAGLVVQRLVAPDTPEGDRAAFVSTQESIDRFLGRRPHGVRFGATLPAQATGALGNLFVVGRCAGLYTVGMGGSWLPVEQTASTGLHELVMRLRPTSSASEAVLTLGRGPNRVTLTVSGNPEAVRFGIRVGGRTEGVSEPIRMSSPAHLTMSIAQFAGRFSATVLVDGRRLFAEYVPGNESPTTIGADPGDPHLRHFSGEIVPVVLDAPVCRRIVQRITRRPVPAP